MNTEEHLDVTDKRILEYTMKNGYTNLGEIATELGVSWIDEIHLLSSPGTLIATPSINILSLSFDSFSLEPNSTYSIDPTVTPIASQPSSTDFAILSPLCVAGPGCTACPCGGGGSTVVTYSASANLQEKDLPSFNFNLYYIAAQLFVTFTGPGGTVVSHTDSYNAVADATIYDWGLISQSQSSSSTSTSYTFTESAHFEGVFPWDGYDTWDVFPEIQITVYNSGVATVYVHDTIYASNQATCLDIMGCPYSLWADVTLYDHSVGSGTAISLTEYITQYE